MEASPKLLATRKGVLSRRREALLEVAQAQDAFREADAADLKNRALRAAQEAQHVGDSLERLLASEFIPQHGPSQLISPSAFFVSPLFCVRSKKTPRVQWLTLEIPSGSGFTLTYRGPELRQSDGLVFMSLLNLIRDTRVGEYVRFSPKELCEAVFGRYDGPARRSLKEHIQRLQSSLIEFQNFTVQLCQKFYHTSAGDWQVAMDRDIVELFTRSRYVWLEFEQRKALPEGLATWLYGYIESQTMLIPTAIEDLHLLCGSVATPKSFLDSLRDALGVLVAAQVIDAGWTIKNGRLAWRKLKSDATPKTTKHQAPGVFDAS